MITTIIILGLALTYLGYETGWMRVRLLVGIETKPVQDKWEQVFSWSIPQRHLEYVEPNFTVEDKWIDPSDIDWSSWSKLPGRTQTTPMCHEWIQSRKHIVPQCCFELRMNGNYYKMAIRNQSALRQVMKVNKLTRKQLASISPL